MRVSVCVCLLVCVCCTLRILNVVQTLLLRCCSHINYANENKINNALLWFFLRCVLLIIFSYFVLLENFSLSFLAWDIIFLLSFPSVWFYCSFQLSLWLSLSLVPFNFISFSLLIHLLFVRSHFSAEINIKISFPVPSAIFTNFSSATQNEFCARCLLLLQLFEGLSIAFAHFSMTPNVYEQKHKTMK